MFSIVLSFGGFSARAGAEGIAIAFCSDEERVFLRDIERLTRQRIQVVPLPVGFTASVEAIRRLKPAPRTQPQKVGQHSHKADRRAESHRREQRNDRHKQRHPQRSEGHAAHRPEGGQPKRPFRGRRRRSGGSRYSAA